MSLNVVVYLLPAKIYPPVKSYGDMENVFNSLMLNQKVIRLRRYYHSKNILNYVSISQS